MCREMPVGPGMIRRRESSGETNVPQVVGDDLIFVSPNLCVLCPARQLYGVSGSA